jgi:hypothetical protein
VGLAVEAPEALRALAALRRRRRRILALKLAGFSYREIMERLGGDLDQRQAAPEGGRAELRRRSFLTGATVLPSAATVSSIDDANRSSPYRQLAGGI